MNTAKYASGEYIAKRWIDLIDPKPEDTRTGREIVEDVVRNAGLKVVRKSGSI